MTDLSTAESRQVKLSPAGIPVDDDFEFIDEKPTVAKMPFQPSHQLGNHNRFEDDHIVDDGENSQLDLVEYAYKN